MATAEDFSITYFDTLTKNQFRDASFHEVPQVKEIQEKIDALQSDLDELGGIEAIESALQKAKEDLEEVEIQHEIGEATDGELTEARTAVEEQQAALRKVQRKAKALDRLKDRKEAALEATKRAALRRATELYEDEMEEVVGQVRDLLESLQKAREVRNSAHRHDRANVMRGVDSEVRLFKNLDSTIEFLESQLEEGG